MLLVALVNLATNLHIVSYSSMSVLLEVGDFGFSNAFLRYLHTVLAYHLRPRQIHPIAVFWKIKQEKFSLAESLHANGSSIE
jgi:hypothetical protein